MNMLLSGLRGLTLAPNPVKESTTATKEVARKRVEKNPTNGADIRIMHTGKAYPSAHFADKYSLEYTNKNGNTISNGVDLFRAQDWRNYTDAGNTQPLLLGYMIPQSKDNPKIELFAGTRYDDEGNPINSVLDQGSVLSDETLELIATGLGYAPGYAVAQDTTSKTEVEDNKVSAWEVMLGDKRYIDLKFEDTEGMFTLPGGKYLIPKAVNKGEKKGELQTVKREQINIMLVTEWTGNQVESPVDVDGQKESLEQDSNFTNSTDEGSEVTSAELASEEPEFENILETAHASFQDAK